MFTYIVLQTHSPVMCLNVKTVQWNCKGHIEFFGLTCHCYPIQTVGQIVKLIGSKIQESISKSRET